MSDTLAVVEKKPQRHGGCVGIFFQLFDWNRRFAKKKLFSKKLLPPADRLKQSSKKFGGDEKQPKIRLIADENKGGFPNVKNNNGGSNSDVDHKHEMRVPGLVARLMGLESMPALHRDKSKKAPPSGLGSGKGEKFVDREELSAEKGGVKHELRPPKLQKTSVSERQAITGFGAEKLPPFKNVLSKSRKHHHHHHPKLPTPVKSPRTGSRKSSSSRLIGAATRILEPGLQTSRLKSSLTYSNVLDQPAQNAAMDNGASTFLSPLEGCEGLNGQQCRNCGYSLDNLGSKIIESERPVVFASPFCAGSSCRGSEISKPGRSFYEDLEEESCEAYVNNIPPHVTFASYKSPLNESGDPLKGMPVSFSSTRKARSENPMLHPRDGLKTHKDSRASGVNQSIGSSMRSRLPTKRDNAKFDMERRIVNRLNDSVPPGRKRRPANISRYGESSGFMSSNVDDQKYGFPQPMSGKQPGHNVHLISHQRSRNSSAANNGPTGTNVVSFTYNSPVKSKSGNDLHSADSLRQLATGKHGLRKRLEKPFPLSGDALGALLQQKLKELTRQGEDIGGNAPKKTTATILHELISALTSEVPFQQEDTFATIPDGRNSWRNHSGLPDSTSTTMSQASAMPTKLYVEQQFENEHLSPGSVLEAYFSTESCPSSSSMEDCHGYKTLTESIEYGQQSPNSERPALTKTPKSSRELVIDILNNVSKALCCSKLANSRLNGSNLECAKDVLLNAELAFHDVTGRSFPIKHLICDELEVLASVLWMNFGCLLGMKDGKEASKLTIFVFDSIIEHLSSRFRGYPKSSRKLPLRTNGNMLILEIVEAVRRWEEMSRFSLDELVEREMSQSLGEWTQYEAEVVETGVEISQCLYQSLVDEVVTDLSTGLVNEDRNNCINAFVCID